MSSGRYRLLRKAREDVIGLSQHIGRDNAAAADRFLDAVEATSDRIAKLPRSGVKRTYNQSALAKMRMIPVDGFRSYLLFYLPSGSAIDVVRVIHSSRDLPTVFS